MRRLFVSVMLVALLVALFPASLVADVTVGPHTYKLIAAQSLIVGNVKVWYDDDDGGAIHVKYQASQDMGQQGYCLKEVHTHVATSLDDIPHSEGGPIPGHFAMVDDDLGCVRTWEHILPFAWDGIQPLYIAAHAVVGRTDDPYWEETGWGVICGKIDEYAFPGSNWAAYILFPDPNQLP
jgi:hypothetical protein